MRDHHRQVIEAHPSVKRGSSHQVWPGKMTPMGSRVAQGGKPGDGYAAYSYLNGGTVEEIDLYFDAAEVRAYV